MQLQKISNPHPTPLEFPILPIGGGGRIFYGTTCAIKQSITSPASRDISIALIHRAWAQASISNAPAEALNTRMWPVAKPPMIKSLQRHTDEQGNLMQRTLKFRGTSYKAVLGEKEILVYLNHGQLQSLKNNQEISSHFYLKGLTTVYNGN